MPHEPITGLSAIAAGYDALLCDVWGVLHNPARGGAHEGAAEALLRASALTAR